MLDVVRDWRAFFIRRGVEQRSIEMLEQAMLPLPFLPPRHRTLCRRGRLLALTS